MTTLHLDDDVATMLRARARARRVSLRKVANELLRHKMDSTEQPEEAAVSVKSFPGGFRAEVDPLKLKQLDAQLQIDEVVRDRGR